MTFERLLKQHFKMSVRAKSISLEREWWTKFSDGMSAGILLKSNLPYQARRKLQKSKTCNAWEYFPNCANSCPGNWVLFLSSAAKLAALSWDPENLKKLSLNAYLQVFATKMPYLQIFATKMPYLKGSGFNFVCSGWDQSIDSPSVKLIANLFYSK